MKKTILAVLALASVVACNKSEVLEVAPQKAISFGNPFVENATKAIDPSWSNTKVFESFNVYGTITNTATPPATANIFNAVNVTRITPPAITSGDKGLNDYVWGYAESSIQYWVPGNSYKFAAVVGGTGVIVNTTDAGYHMPETIEYDASSQTDLLYAENNYGTFSNTSKDCVEFGFNHLLAKAKFTFTNGCPKGYTVTVTNVSITNAYADGEYTVGSTTWAPGADREGLTFGNIVNSTETADNAVAVAILSNTDITEAITAGTYTNETKPVYSSNYERLLIPAEYTETKLGIKFSYIITNKEGIEVRKVTDKEASVEITLAAGNSYNFTAEIKEDLTPITFTVTSTGSWTSQDQTVTIE